MVPKNWLSNQNLAFEIYLENWVWLDTYLEPNVNSDTLNRSWDDPKSYFKLYISLNKSPTTVASLTLIGVIELENKPNSDRKTESFKFKMTAKNAICCNFEKRLSETKFILDGPTSKEVMVRSLSRQYFFLTIWNWNRLKIAPDPTHVSNKNEWPSDSTLWL